MPPGRRPDWQERGGYDRERDFRQREWPARGDPRRDNDPAGHAGGWGRARDIRGDRARDDVPGPRGRYAPPPGQTGVAGEAVSDAGPSVPRPEGRDDGRGDRYGAPRAWGAGPPPGPLARGSWRRSPSPSRSSSPRSSSKRSSPAPARRPPSPPSAGSYRSRETWDDGDRARTRRESNEVSTYDAGMHRSESTSLLAPPPSQPDASTLRGSSYDNGPDRRGSLSTTGGSYRDAQERGSGQPPSGPGAYSRSASSVSLTAPSAPGPSPHVRPSERPSFASDYIQPRLQQAFAASLTSIRSLHDMHNGTQQRALRKALQDLADAEVELAGARVRTSVTEASLERIREEAELWSTESARLEIEQRNSGIEGYWTARFNDKSAEAVSIGQASDVQAGENLAA